MNGWTNNLERLDKIIALDLENLSNKNVNEELKNYENL